MPDTTDLLGELATLKAMLIALEARSLRKDERIARLEKLVAGFRQAAFGRRSEKSDPDQFELALEDLETAIATIHAEEDAEIAAQAPAADRGGDRARQPDLRLWCVACIASAKTCRIGWTSSRPSSA